MQVKIALAADTILYLPIYCIEQVYRPASLQILLESTDAGSGQLGDAGAYDLLQRGAVDLCVCDPMLLLQEYRKEKQETIGAVVASLVTKTGLWALRCTPADAKVDPRRSLAEIRKEHGEKLGTVLTYDTASTAGHVVRHMQDQKRWEFKDPARSHLQCHFGEELRYLSDLYQLQDGGSVAPDLVITCDLCGAIATEARFTGSPANSARVSRDTSFPKEEGFDSTLFTALVAHRGFLANNRSAVVTIVEALQDVLDHFYTNDRLRWSMAQMLVQRDSLFPSLRRFSWDKQNDRQQFCEKALDELKNDAVLARTVRLKPAQWERQAKIWGINSIDGDDAYGFKACTNPSIAEEASPGIVVRQTRRLRRHALVVIIPFILLFEVFHGFAVFYHLYNRHPDRIFWVGIPLVTLIVFFVLWLFGLSRKHELE